MNPLRMTRTPDKPNAGTLRQGGASRTCMDDEERQALRAEGLDPDDPAVIAAIDLVRWELSLGRLSRRTRATSVHALRPRDHKRYNVADAEGGRPPNGWWPG